MEKFNFPLKLSYSANPEQEEGQTENYFPLGRKTFDHEKSREQNREMNTALSSFNLLYVFIWKSLRTITHKVLESALDPLNFLRVQIPT